MAYVCCVFFLNISILSKMMFSCMYILGGKEFCTGTVLFQGRINRMRRKQVD